MQRADSTNKTTRVRHQMIPFLGFGDAATLS
jgi:hypothetical protein